MKIGFNNEDRYNNTLKTINVFILFYICAILLTLYLYINFNEKIFRIINGINMGALVVNVQIFKKDSLFSNLQIEKDIENRIQILITIALLLNAFLVLISLFVSDQSFAKIIFIVYIIAIIIFAMLKKIIINYTN